jgi:hypothetical protein
MLSTEIPASTVKVEGATNAPLNLAEVTVVAASIPPAVKRNSAFTPELKALAEVPSCALTTVKLIFPEFPEQLVTLTISLLVRSSMVSRKKVPDPDKSAAGNTLPSVTGIVVVELFTAPESVVLALFLKTIPIITSFY